jgi:hypothetical protein
LPVFGGTIISTLAVKILYPLSRGSLLKLMQTIITSATILNKLKLAACVFTPEEACRMTEEGMPCAFRALRGAVALRSPAMATATTPASHILRSLDENLRDRGRPGGNNNSTLPNHATTSQAGSEAVHNFGTNQFYNVLALPLTQ